MALPPLVLDVPIFAELPHMTLVPDEEAAEQEVIVDTEVHTTSLKGWFSRFLQISHAVINCGDFDFGCAGVSDDDLCQLA
jgi:hypothetical protein